MLASEKNKWKERHEEKSREEGIVRMRSKWERTARRYTRALRESREPRELSKLSLVSPEVLFLKSSTTGAVGEC